MKIFCPDCEGTGWTGLDANAVRCERCYCRGVIDPENPPKRPEKWPPDLTCKVKTGKRTNLKILDEERQARFRRVSDEFPRHADIQALIDDARELDRRLKSRRKGKVAP